jgi:hypothetical protein
VRQKSVITRRAYCHDDKRTTETNSGGRGEGDGGFGVAARDIMISVLLVEETSSFASFE